MLKKQISSFSAIGIIAVGNVLIIMLLITVGIMVINSMRHMASINAEYYKHPLVVNNAALVIKFKMELIRDRIQEVIVSRNVKKLDGVSTELAILDKSIKENFRIVEIGFLGNLEKVKEAHRLLDKWRDIRGRIIELAKHEHWDKVDKLIVIDNWIILSQLIADVDDIVYDTRHRAEAFVKAPNNDAMTEISQVVWLLASFATAIFVIGMEMSRRIGLLVGNGKEAAKIIEVQSYNKPLFRSDPAIEIAPVAVDTTHINQMPVSAISKSKNYGQHEQPFHYNLELICSV